MSEVSIFQEKINTLKTKEKKSENKKKKGGHGFPNKVTRLSTAVVVGT